jgi:hypothetical protein
MQEPREKGDCSYSLLASALDGVSGQRHYPYALYPRGRTTGIHGIGGWVGLGSGLDKEAKEKILWLCQDQTLVAQSAVTHCID